jgi:hypothetical protein
MEPVLTTVVTALVAGAAAKAKDIASEAVADAYNGLKAMVVRKLGKSGAVQSVEDNPGSEASRTALVEALATLDLERDRQLKGLAEQIVRALSDVKAGPETGNIEIATIRGGVNVVVENLAATGRIQLGPVVAGTGDARVSGLSAGSDITAIITDQIAREAEPKKN